MAKRQKAPKEPKPLLQRTWFKILLGIIVLAIIGNMISGNDTNTATETATTENVTEATTEIPLPTYATEYNYVSGDPSAYEGRNVAETTINGSFNLDDPNIKEIAMNILDIESKKAFAEYPDSELVRIFIMQEGEDTYPLAAGTYEVQEDKSLKLSEDTTSRFPLLDQKE